MRECESEGVDVDAVVSEVDDDDDDEVVVEEFEEQDDSDVLLSCGAQMVSSASVGAVATGS